LKKVEFLDLSGYSFTGKSAFNDLFCEFKSFHTQAYNFEFDLLRTKDGILDLYFSLIEHWSPVRSAESIRQFQNVINAYKGNYTFLDRLLTTGRHYDYKFPGFTEESEAYLKDLVDSLWHGQWPYAFEKKNKFDILRLKILYNLGFKNIFESEVYLSAPSKEFFIQRTNQYLYNVLTSNIEVDTSVVVMNNVFEPFNPLLSMQFFDNAKSIIIDRDPRDIYLAAWEYVNSDGSKGWRATLGKNVEDFVIRFKKYRNKTSKEDKNVLKVNFEDLVLDYDKTLKKLYDFLQINDSLHIHKQKYFKPSSSSKGIQMWKNTHRKKEIEYISKNLSEYCR
jgi:hypothetical protein